MLMPLKGLVAKYGMNITGVLHIGAHEAEEAEAYRRQNIKNVWWVEGNPELIPRLEAILRRYPRHKLIQAVMTDVDGDEVTFHVTNNKQSSSVLEFGTHSVVSPEVEFTHDLQLRTSTIDTIAAQYEIPDTVNFMNLDIQGAELLALKGGERFLEHVDYIYTEINVDELYVGCVRLYQLSDWLGKLGFSLKEKVMAGDAGWGDGLYIREK